MSTVNDYSSIRAKYQSQKLAAIYYRAGAELFRTDYTSRAERTSICSDTIVLAGGKVVNQWFCKDRLCPTCARHVSRQLAVNARLVIERAIEQTNCVPYMLTLTQLNCTCVELPARVTDMLAAWRGITHGLRSARRYVLGYARTIEITISKSGDYHPHVHAIMLMDRDAPREMLRAGYWANLWRDYMGTDAYQSVAPICHMQRIHPNARKHITSTAAAAAEVAKYVSKCGQILDRADNYQRVLDIDAAICGRKLRSYGGIWRIIRAQLKLTDEKPIDIDIDYAAGVSLEVWRWSGADKRYQRV